MKNENQNQNQTIIFEPVTPHPQPVAIGELLADIENTIKRHVVLSDAAATALAVWVLHTYAFERRDTVAYVAIESPEKRCGKTTLLTVLAAMANKPLITSNVTVGALFRAIDKRDARLCCCVLMPPARIVPDNRRFTRCTLGYSKKLENLRFAVWLFVWHFNFVRKHSTVGKTPAMAAGLMDKPMTITDLLSA